MHTVGQQPHHRTTPGRWIPVVVLVVALIVGIAGLAWLVTDPPSVVDLSETTAVTFSTFTPQG